LKLKHELQVIRFSEECGLLTFLPQMYVAKVFLFLAAKWSKDNFRKIEFK